MTLRVAFMCVQNAGRSQMATVFAEQERTERGLTEAVEILTGGTHPANHVHDEVITVMSEAEFDLSGRTPRTISTSELESCGIVCTMGCSTLGPDADASSVDVRDWAPDDPDGQPIERVREIRETVRQQVRTLFDEIEQGVGDSA
jgi:arsenate reductase